MTTKLLLKNGTALIHGSSDHIEAVKTDIIIEGNKISKIGNNLRSSGAEVLDCTDKLISPGFVDTHHHVWQTQIRGKHANHTLLEYFPSGNFVSSLYTPADMFWGQLGGCLEMLNCGTTTVVDFAHLNYSPENNYKAISATVSSGIRSIFCYCPNPRLTSWEPFTVDPNGFSGHSFPVLKELGEQSPFGDGRVTLGFAFDGFQFVSKEQLRGIMGTLDELKIPLIQFHYTPGPLMGKLSIPEKIEELGFLDERFLIAHSSSIEKSDVELYRKRGVHISTTPSTELQMSMGFPVPSYDDNLNMADLCSLGVDCHSATSSFIPYEARLALQSSRAGRAQKLREQGKEAKTITYTVEEAFNQATIRGARAAKIGDKVGSIAEGKLADLVIFDALAPSMVCGSINDPVGTIILNSSPADIDAVIVNGILRKQDGRLKDVKLDDHGKEVAGTDLVTWNDVAKALEASHHALYEQIDKIDMKEKEEAIINMWHLDANSLSDSL